MYQKIAFIAIVLLHALDASAGQSVVDSVRVDISKYLEDGVDLNPDDVTNVEIFFICSLDAVNATQIQITRVTVTRPRRFGGEDVKLYFANEAKNLLEVTVTTKGFSGILYAVPHDSAPMNLGSRGIGDEFQQTGGESVLHIDKSWFPQGFGKASASLQVRSTVFNYYGLKNFPISLPDTMVVENYLNIPCDSA